MFIRRADGKPVAFSGQWEIWRPPEVPLYRPGADPPIRSAAIIKAEPAHCIATVHDQMPLALPEARWNEWLTRNDLPHNADWLLAAREEIVAQMTFTATRVSDRVNSPRHDDPACVAAL